MAKIIPKDYERVSIKPEKLAGTVDFGLIFGRAGAVHLEIGIG